MYNSLFLDIGMAAINRNTLVALIDEETLEDLYDYMREVGILAGVPICCRNAMDQKPHDRCLGNYRWLVVLSSYFICY